MVKNGNNKRIGFNNEKALEYFRQRSQFTAKQFQKKFKTDLKTSYEILNKFRDKSVLVREGAEWILNPSYNVDYLDWNGNLSKLEKLYKLKLFTLLIGSKGTGKNESVLALAKKLNLNLISLNLSLRTREHHIIGRLDVESNNGTKRIVWKKGPLPLSMEEGCVLILDELNASEPDVLLRLDESLDERRELNYEGQHIVAHKDWWVVGIINPLDHPGTKELPPQLIRRFPARLIYEYPDPLNELKIIKKKVGVKQINEDLLFRLLDLFNVIRNNSDLPYTPSITESITAAQLLNSGTSMNEVIDITLLNTLRQWGVEPIKEAKELAISKGIYLEDKLSKNKKDTTTYL